ncbi:MAG TPA: endolytic transglycosylase MltG [Patescibacteria group bacterium]|nr:endolytic transglycosylase MltG [Patescibacteria group bacterium]
MKKWTFLFSIAVVFLLIAIFWWQTQLAAVNAKNTTSQTFVVAEGSSLRQIANNLVSAGLIKNSFAFTFYMKLNGLDSKIQKGNFEIAPSLDSAHIATLLTSTNQDIWVTIPEGKRADEIADILKTKLPTYNDTWRSKLKLEEGYLFPDTYLFPHDSTVETVISVMENNFSKKWQEAVSQQTNKLSKQDAVIIASILQREAPSGEDMKKVASVIENRLAIGMALQVDATVQYALGYQLSQDTWWKKNLTVEDIHTSSPYNTYAQPGLPPTPISNPGLEALEAALSPADTNYLYYISDSHGVMHYASTLDQHNANIRKYGL